MQHIILTHKHIMHEQIQQNYDKHQGSKQGQKKFRFPKYSCNECNFTSPMKRAVNNHKQVEHSHGINYKCNMCDT